VHAEEHRPLRVNVVDMEPSGQLLNNTDMAEEVTTGSYAIHTASNLPQNAVKLFLLTFLTNHCTEVPSGDISYVGMLI